jgi:hypothetical protein
VGRAAAEGLLSQRLGVAIALGWHHRRASPRTLSTRVIAWFHQSMFRPVFPDLNSDVRGLAVASVRLQNQPQIVRARIDGGRGRMER